MSCVPLLDCRPPACTFLAPVALKKGTTGRLKVQVRFLGNRVLKPTKRTTKLQVNG